MKTLKQYADERGIKYRAAWNRFKSGKIAGAYQDELGKILIPDGKIQDDILNDQLSELKTILNSIMATLDKLNGTAH